MQKLEVAKKMITKTFYLIQYCESGAFLELIKKNHLKESVEAIKSIIKNEIELK